ncbi:MAG: hypothetical protein LBP59_08005 [Planctomycetaceae bacterium]|jgi:hypothetical protein|nr:hypothetical protein [Planctomycetaceae bacterium]
MNISAGDFGSLLGKLSERYRSAVSPNIKSANNSTVNLLKNNNNNDKRTSDFLTLHKNNKSTISPNSTYIPPSLAHKSNVENTNQEINEINENINAEITNTETKQKESTTEPTTESIDNTTTKNVDNSTTQNIKGIIITDPRLVNAIKSLKLAEYSPFITAGDQMRQIKSKYGGGSIGNYLFDYDKVTHKTDMEKFIADKLVEIEKNTKQIIPGNGTTNYTFDNRSSLEIEYWEYLHETGKSFYEDSSQHDIPEYLKENETVYFRENGLIKTRSIGYINIEQNNNSNAPKNNITEQKNIIQDLFINVIDKKITQKKHNGEKPHFFKTDPAIEPNEQTKQNANDVKFLIKDYLSKNNITLDSKEGFIITLLDNGNFILEETNINDSTKLESIKNLIETDKTLQQELTKIFANNELFQNN